MMVKKGTATGLSWCLVLLVVACVFFGSAHALIHKLKIRDDPRGSFFIESFGFEAGGKLKMNFTNLKIDGGSKNLEEARAGFIIKRTSVRYHGFIDEHMTPECLFDIQNRVREPFEETIIITDFEALQREITVRVDGTSFYNVYFVSCQKPGTLISFDLDMEMYNPVLDYLSTGDSVLPTLYTFFSFVYLLTAVWWIWFYMRPGEGRQIYRIHYLMTILLLLKMAAVFFHAVEMHYLKINGHPGAWSIVYFIFALMKGVMFFVVVGLIGSGWGFIKPFLSDKDKNILLFVIPLQVIDNIALAIIEETAPGSFIWLTWVDIFRIVDIVCCVAVLAPIVWSVNHLKQASQVDGKATRDFTKLKLFQTFYLTVISFIYMTRIIVYLLDSSLNFRWTWMAVFVSEVSTLVFILCTGNMFKPVADNPFLKMDTERDVELNEFNDRDSAAEIHHPLDRDD